MRFTAQQHHDMTRLLRRKALKASAPDPMRRRAISFLALAKTAHKQATATAATPPKAPPSLTPVRA
jgi:hypothetical protein